MDFRRGLKPSMSSSVLLDLVFSFAMAKERARVGRKEVGGLVDLPQKPQRKEQAQGRKELFFIFDEDSW
jgi:hypothetical protein